MDILTASESPTEPLDRTTFLNVARPQPLSEQVVCDDSHKSAPVASPRSTASSPPPQQSGARVSALEDEEEWEIRRIIGKRRAGKGYEYKVRWKDTWLPKSELGNARRLLQEFEAQCRSQRGPEPRRVTCIEKLG